MNTQLLEKFTKKVQIKLINDKGYSIFDKVFSSNILSDVLTIVVAEMDRVKEERQKAKEVEELTKLAELSAKYKDVKVKQFTREI